jgi:hypothetical protein
MVMGLRVPEPRTTMLAKASSSLPETETKVNSRWLAVSCWAQKWRNLYC